MFGLELIVDVVAVFVSFSFFTTQNFIVISPYYIPFQSRRGLKYDNDVEMVQLINGAH